MKKSDLENLNNVQTICFFVRISAIFSAHLFFLNKSFDLKISFKFAIVIYGRERENFWYGKMSFGVWALVYMPKNLILPINGSSSHSGATKCYNINTFKTFFKGYHKYLQIYFK